MKHEHYETVTGLLDGSAVIRTTMEPVKEGKITITVRLEIPRDEFGPEMVEKCLTIAGLRCIRLPA